MLLLWLYLVGVIAVAGWLYWDESQEECYDEDTLFTPMTNFILTLLFGLCWPFLLAAYLHSLGEAAYLRLRGKTQ